MLRSAVYAASPPLPGLLPSVGPFCQRAYRVELRGTDKGYGSMKKKRIAMIAAAAILTMGTIASAQFKSLNGVPKKDLQGSKPYTPTRLEWLCVELNARTGFKNISPDRGFQIFYIPMHQEDGIVLYVHYVKEWADREAMNTSVESCIEILKMASESKGWDKWVTYEVKYDPTSIDDK
jgi:hypothetical protein